MLDPKGTFDDLIPRYADSAEQAEDIRANRLYRNLTGALSGTQEYMAMEKLYELVEEGGFDLVVVDTPPTRNALDFLDAPRRLTQFLENRLFQALMAPTRAWLGPWAWPPRPCCAPSPRWPAPRSSTTPSPSSRPSRAWRRGSASGRPGCGELLVQTGDRLRAGRLAPARRGRRGRATSPAGWPSRRCRRPR